MPIAGHPDSNALQGILRFIESQNPDVCELISLPESSHEGRKISALRIGPERSTHGVLFTAGVHSNEIVNPSLVAFFGMELSHAHKHGLPLRWGPRAYSAATVRRIVRNLQIFLLPNVNPDGREHVLAPGGDPMWRKNRGPNGGAACKGVT